jgi:hypothetical protein
MKALDSNFIQRLFRHVTCPKEIYQITILEDTLWQIFIVMTTIGKWLRSDFFCFPFQWPCDLIGSHLVNIMSLKSHTSFESQLKGTFESPRPTLFYFNSS